MNIRKRLLALILAAACMTSTVHAVEPGNGTGELNFSSPVDNPTADIYGKYQAADEPKAVYHVELSWPSMVFQYKTKGQRIWDPTIHKFLDGDVTYDWETQKLDVHAENKSNKPVTVTGNWQAGEKTYGLTIFVGNSPCKLDSADGGLNPEGDISLTAKGNGTPDFTTPSGQNINIGTLTLTVSATESP